MNNLFLIISKLINFYQNLSQSFLVSVNPLDQFKIKAIIPFELFGVNLNFTNSALMKVIIVTVILGYLLLNIRKITVIPGKFQVIIELLYNFVINLVKENAGNASAKFVPLIFSLFLFILFCNLFGLLPYSFTPTSHILVTFSLAALLFIVIIVCGVAKFGFKFFSILLPPGVPMAMMPLMIVIELFAYLARPVSLAIRLSANMTAGHTMLKMMGIFVVSMGLLGGWVPFLFLIMLTAFEIFVAILQAYIFTILACVYLSDASTLHH